MTTIGGHSSAYTMQGEQVGLGARRKIPVTCVPDPASCSEHHNRVPVPVVDMAYTNGLPRNGYKKRDRRHVYHDILPLKIEESGNIAPGTCEQSDGNVDNNMLPTTSNVIKGTSQKPAIPPKPKYILRDKRLRHVYQMIDLPTSNPKDGIPVPPPPLPYKPSYLQKLDDSESLPPPLPPRVVNVDAIRQRQKLDHEYFENLRKSVDEDLLDLAEEGDLPVSVHNDGQLPASPTRQEYGAHSPPLPTSVTIFSDDDQTQLPEIRRHSLPLYESISDTENSSRPSNSPPPVLPIRSNSHDFESENDTVPHNLPKKNQSEVNLSQNLMLLKRCGWYWGNMTWQEAEKLLSLREGEGVFLMRDSQNPVHLLTLTVRSTTNTVHHVRVEYSEGKFQLYEPGRTVSRSTAQCVRHSNIEQFINLAIKHSKSGSFLYFLKPKNMGELPVQIRFISPISRFSKVKSLQYLSRMTIRNCAVAELMPSLSLPPKIRQYLMSGPYYDPNEDI